MSDHSIIGPSALHRVLKCSAATDYEREQGGGTTEAAEYGTHLHEAAEACLVTNTHFADTYVGMRFHDRELDEEGAGIVQPYLTAVAVLFDLYNVMWVEKKIHSRDFPMFFGTVDCVLIRTEGLKITRVHVVDLKTGLQPVFPQNNKQGQGYLHLVLEEIAEVMPNHVVTYDVELKFTIVQPRFVDSEGKTVRTATFSNEDMLKFYADLAMLVDDINTGYLRFQSGNHCQFCPRKPTCPKLREEALAMLDAPTPDTLTPEQLAEVLDKASAIRSYIDSVKKYANGLMEKGTRVPGYALKKSYGNRKWILPPDELKKKLQNKKFRVADIEKKELLSPAQMEKVVGAEVVNQFTDRELKGTVVVSEGSAGAFMPEDALNKLDKLEG